MLRVPPLLSGSCVRFLSGSLLDGVDKCFSLFVGAYLDDPISGIADKDCAGGGKQCEYGWCWFKRVEVGVGALVESMSIPGHGADWPKYCPAVLRWDENPLDDDFKQYRDTLQPFFRCVRSVLSLHPSRARPRLPSVG